MLINVFDRMRIDSVSVPVGCGEVCVCACVCVWGKDRSVCVFRVSDYAVASSRRHDESSEHTWMRSSHSSQGTLPWTR